MVPFLKQVADFYFRNGTVQDRCFVFPNRRSMLFFRKYLCESVAEAGKPMAAPQMYTINDFFYKVSDRRPVDRVHLLLELYDCYKALNPKAEPLDDFIFWGDVIISDFNDVDKYLVDAKGLFTNVSELKDIRDKYEYLSEGQKEAIERFLSHFKTGGDVKETFLRLWEILYGLYSSYNAALSAKGLCYEGMVYRALAERVKAEPVVDVLEGCFGKCRQFVFVGLNALNECEKTLLRRMRSAGIAEYCWDYDKDGMIGDKANKSSLFMRDNIVEFPQAFGLDSEEPGIPQINILSVPSSIGQAARLSSILPADAGIETAVVLPDENLLIPVLNSIPAEINDINVTMGYPMSGSGFHSLMAQIASLQVHMRQRDGKWYFYHKQVLAIFSNSLVKTAAGQEGEDCVASIKSEGQYYIPQESFEGVPVFKLIFQPVVTEPTVVSSQTVARIQQYQKDVISGLAAAIRTVPDMALELDFAREYYLAVSKLAQHPLEILPATYFRLLSQMVSGQSVPFKGEPLQGLQIMGPLETRALDFENLIILSCNEGVFPRKSVASSFIPAELRRAFGLPTYEYQDAVWAYYFYRMIRRASTVWMLYDSRLEGLRSGEESRYIKQLELHFGVKTHRYVAKSDLRDVPSEESVPKTPEDVSVIKEKSLSASALQNYLDCPAKFYYGFVKDLRPEEEVSESLDAASLGTVFHAAMQELYTRPDGLVTRSYINSLLSEKKTVRELVRSLILKELKAFELEGRNIVTANIICQYVEKVLERDLELMDSYATDSFTILGLEKKCTPDFEGFHFKGYIDRLDSFVPGQVRVVDYKTGKVEDDELVINEDNAEKVVRDLFAEGIKKRPKIALQLYLYDMFVKEDPKYLDKTILNAIYPASGLFVSPVKNVELCEQFCYKMRERLKEMLVEMVDTEVPFRRTENAITCSYCDFKTICGR